ncbi:MAG: hypothetical protein APF78_01835 [Sphingomonadales bacterium BRH_c3]|nr:MAG: hypothetical protein APF78_01835 [Sphingomonadales bacterium BRH_c3]
MNNVTSSLSIDQETIDRWANITGDFNPLHVQPEFAEKTRFGGTIAHGHLSLAFILGEMLKLVGPEWLHGGTLRNVCFNAPVRPAKGYELLITGCETGSAVNWKVEIRDKESGEISVQCEATLGGDGLWE